MKPKMNCTETIKKIISGINEYTGAPKANLTEAVAELIRKSKRGSTIIGGICSATVEEVRAEDFGSITKIIDYLFRNNPDLRYVELPRTVTTLGQNCFDGCTNLDMPYLPDGIEVLNYRTFADCRNLTLSKLPDMLRYIDEAAFYYCTNLRISEIPAGVETIKRNAFGYCSSIESITFRGTPTSIAGGVFNNCSKLKVINVPWSKGEVANAPWGALNATINYNCTV